VKTSKFTNQKLFFLSFCIFYTSAQTQLLENHDRNIAKITKFDKVFNGQLPIRVGSGDNIRLCKAAHTSPNEGARITVPIPFRSTAKQHYNRPLQINLLAPEFGM
jgi:hypothetical protein